MQTSIPITRKPENDKAQYRLDRGIGNTWLLIRNRDNALCGMINETDENLVKTMAINAIKVMEKEKITPQKLNGKTKETV